jgi:hypothetical protein
MSRSGITLVTGQFYPHSFTLDDLATFERFVEEHSRCMWYSDVAHESVTDTDAIAVRHDVDHSATHARKFARWEAERGINASYYFLPTAPYFGQGWTNDIMLEIQSLGHEIGIHNNALTHVAKTGGPDATSTQIDDAAIQLLIEWREMFEEIGIHVTGCADHGGGEPRNVDLWGVYGRTPMEAGLAYECYALHERGANYISDNRGTWRSPLVKVEGKQTHVLIHPEHWRLS